MAVEEILAYGIRLCYTHCIFGTIIISISLESNVLLNQYVVLAQHCIAYHCMIAAIVTLCNLCICFLCNLDLLLMIFP